MQRVIREYNDDFIRNRVLYPEKSLIFEFKHYGELNANKFICCIYKNGTDGFFAYYRYVLESLYFADKFNFVPVVCYGEKNPYYEGGNTFESYFAQPRDISLEEIKNSKYVIYSDHVYNEMFIDDTSYRLNEENMLKLISMHKKYIKLNAGCKRIIDESVRGMLKEDRILGVHIRGGDYGIGYNDHPVQVVPDEYYEHIDHAMKEFQFDYIFLATDSEEALSCILHRYKEKVLYYKDVYRSKGNVDVQAIKNVREHHGYLCGIEVLRDVYTLANCDGFLAGLSQVSYAVQIIKRAEADRMFEYLNIIDKGLNQNGRDRSDEELRQKLVDEQIQIINQ